jgi:hypothetical protein
MGDPGSRGSRLRRGVPGHGRLPGSGPLDDPGLVPICCPGSRSRTPAASGSSWPGFPPLALCGVTGDQFRRPDDGPVRHAPADGRAIAMAIRKTLSAADAGRCRCMNEYDAFLCGPLAWAPVSPIGVQEGDRQLRALDVCVVAQARERDRGDAQPGKLLAGVQRVVLTAGQDYRCPRSCHQLRHVGCSDGERARVHGQPPSPLLLAQARIHGGASAASRPARPETRR